MTTPAHARRARDSDFDLLSWDSERFGFPVARVRPSVPPEELGPTVEEMRRAGVVLAYYTLDVSRPRIPAADARRFGATLIDTRIVYGLPLSSSMPLSSGADATDSVVIESRSPGPISPRLVALGRAAGEYSRFHVDPRIPSSVFHSIYDAWLSRSIGREIAEDVFVAVTSPNGPELGVVTVGAPDRIASIGLLAVDQTARGRGLGRRLVATAAVWGAARRCEELRVATQVANRPACAMYESAGCTVVSRDNTYHLWLR